MYEREVDEAKRAAEAASRRIMEIYAGDFVAEEKLGVDQFYEPVTEADREASLIIVEHLGRAFPDDAILSEEETDDVERRISKDRVWFIDPIDGTSGFVKRDGDFAVQIGLAVGGKPVVGVVLLPFHGVTYFASKDDGAFMESAGELVRLEASSSTDFRDMQMAVSRNHRSSKMNAILKDFGVKGEMQRGSVGLKIGLIAERKCDLYIHISNRTKHWDTCGPQAILEEAGGRLTDLFGEDIVYDTADVQNHGGIVATNGAVHDMTIERLRPLLSDFGRSKYRTRTE
jgi:3'(2'), 5'-bisphosphate nucleotidase